MAASTADCHKDKSGRPTDNLRRASTHPFFGAGLVSVCGLSWFGFPNGSEIENAGNGLRDHDFLVGADDSDFDAARGRRNNRDIRRVAISMEPDSKKTHPITDSLPN